MHRQNRNQNGDVDDDVDDERGESAPAAVAADAPAAEATLAATVPEPSPLSMSLTGIETRWALEIKDAVQQDDDLQDLTDFEYAHYALVTKGDLDSALYKIKGMQTFREEYNIQNTLEEGKQLVRALQKQQPWFVLDVEYEPQYSHFVCVYDYGRCNPSKVRLPEDWRDYLGGLFYVFQLLQANLGSIREGLVHICECEGMGWNNFSVDFARCNWYHLIEFYPIINKEVSWLHTSIIGNMMHAQYKAMMGAEVAGVIRVGCQFEAYDGRLDEVFKMPSPEIAQARLFGRYDTFLAARFHNQAAYVLPDVAPTPEEDDDNDDDGDDDDDNNNNNNMIDDDNER